MVIVGYGRCFADRQNLIPSSMNESTAKGIFKYLKELGVP
ncbi:DUF1889 family protein, partial [Escherichia coli]|nr:DUF1889 family protein [Escherichia coli]